MNMFLSGGEGLTRPASLHEVEARYRAVFDAVNDGVFIIHPETGCFIEINKAGCQIFGYEEAELIGATIGSLSSGVYPFTQREAIERNKKAQLEILPSFEWQCRTKSNVLFWTDISIRYAKIGHTKAITAVVRDISERKRREDELALALETLSAASEAKSVFLSNMSHELRTPLNAIIGFSDLMLSQPLGQFGNPRYYEYVDDIHRSGMLLLALINDVLDLSRIDAGRATLVEQRVCLRRVINDTCRMVGSQAKRSNIKIVINLPSDLSDVRGDERRITQIILNLLSNAIKFTPGPGTITVRGEQSVSGLLLEVRDTGIGITDVHMSKVLDRFGQLDSRLSRKYQGTGLGLPLAKEMMELHGGSLAIASEVGVGTAVSIVFPPERIIKMGHEQKRSKQAMANQTAS